MVVVMSADHAHEQREQQEPAKARKHALRGVTIHAAQFARQFPLDGTSRPAGNWRPHGSAFGACCCAGKLRSPAPPTASSPHPAPTNRAEMGPQNLRQRCAPGGGPTS
jgi:hypothetical protein